MINVEEAKRLIKRAILSNIACEKMDLAITPLISGKHGIGKSQMIKSIASDLHGTCITIEGGTLKEGEITGLPYQYKDEKGNVGFRFLPYYAVERIQKEEKRLFLSGKNLEEAIDNLAGDENRYSNNDISPQEKIDLLLKGKVRPVIFFIDEINRTENTVYKELMKILLTRSVNGYVFPWWVFFVGAMNPSTQNSVYATNEMDPAQLDRFLKIKVGDDAKQWVKYASASHISDSIISFIKENPKCLSSDDKELDDEEKPTPSPRGWDMADTILKSEPLLRFFFTKEENDPRVVSKDMKRLLSAKLGTSVATMFFASLVSQSKPLSAEELFDDDAKLSKNKPIIQSLSPAKKIQTCDLLLSYLKENIDFLKLGKKDFEKKKKQMSLFVSMLDSSSKLLFAQNLQNSYTSSGDSLFDDLFDIFESDLIEMLELSEKTKKLIEGKRK